MTLTLVWLMSLLDCLVYTENTSKNNQGGLAHRKIKPKRVTCYPNHDNPQRCLVRLFQVYVEHRPAECDDTFYLTPLKKTKGAIWYSKMAVGHNTLAKTVSRLCNSADISGFKTNHSLRVTTATRLFHSGADEQLIMSHTSHRSIDGVRSYKRENEHMRLDWGVLILDYHYQPQLMGLCNQQMNWPFSNRSACCAPVSTPCLPYVDCPGCVLLRVVRNRAGFGYFEVAIGLQISKARGGARGAEDLRRGSDGGSKIFGTGSKPEKAGLAGSSGRSKSSKYSRHSLRMASSSSPILKPLLSVANSDSSVAIAV